MQQQQQQQLSKSEHFTHISTSERVLRTTKPSTSKSTITTTPITTISRKLTTPTTRTKSTRKPSPSTRSTRRRASENSDARPAIERTATSQKKIGTVKCFQVQTASTKVKCFKISNTLLTVSQKRSDKRQKLRSSVVQTTTNKPQHWTETKFPTTLQLTTPTSIQTTTLKTTTSTTTSTTALYRKRLDERKKMNLKRHYQNLTFSAVDCGDKVCNLRHELRRDCTIFIHTNNTECQIPCRTTGCNKEVHHGYLNCPIWECSSKRTTTSTTTTPTTTPTPFSTTRPSPSPNGPNSLIISSVSLNVVFVVVVILFILYRKFYRQRRQRQRRANRNRRAPLLDNNDRYFTLGSDSSEANSPVPSAPTFPQMMPMNEFSAPLLNERNPDSSYFQDIHLGSPLRFTPTPPTGADTFYHRSYSTFKPSPPQTELLPGPQKEQSTEQQIENAATFEVETVL